MLTAVRTRSGLTIRDLGRTLDVPYSTLGGYFSGRHTPTWTLLQRILVALHVPPDEHDEWLAAVQRVRAASDRRVSRPPTPYKGLVPFDEGDSDLFFGRTALTAQIVRLVLTHPVTAVVGASGSGKSSVLRAGVIPALRAQGRTAVLITPSTAPAEWPDPDGVLVVDQFEELFVAADADERAAFLALLTSRPGPVVFGLRADLYADAAAEAALRPALEAAQVVVGPMSRAEMREAIALPAQRVGASLEPGLIDIILDDVEPRRTRRPSGYDAGALPLLSHALLAAWEHADGNHITVQIYREAGGIEGAVQDTAEAVYAELEPRDQEVARRLFVRLTARTADGVLVRRALRAHEVAALDGADTAHGVIDRFVENRLLTVTGDRVVVSHEALLHAWPRLQDWLADNHEERRLLRRLADAAGEWHESGHEPSLLWRGVRLQAARDLAESPLFRDELSAREREFVEAGVEDSTGRARRDRRRAARLRILLAIAAVLLLLAAILAVVAVRAERSAQQSRRNALSRQVAGTAVQLARSDPALAQQLALVAYQTAPTAAARSALLQQASALPITRLLGPQGPTPLAVSSDASAIAVGHADGGIALFAGTTPLGRRATVRQSGQVFALAFAPGGHLLATGGQDSAVHLWDVSDLRRPRPLATAVTHFAGAVQTLAFTRDGGTLLAGSAGPHPVVAWSTADPAHPREVAAPVGVPAGDTVQSLAVDPSGTGLAAVTAWGGDAATPPDRQRGSVLSWPDGWTGGRHPVVAQPGPRTVYAVAYSPDGRTIYAGDAAGDISVLDARTAAARPGRIHLPGGGKVTVLAASSDGSRIAAGSGDDTLTQWQVGTTGPTGVTEEPAPLSSLADPGVVTGVAYGPGGRRLFWTATDGTLRQQPTHPAIVADGTVFNLGLSRDHRRLLVTVGQTDDPGLQVWDVGDPQRPAPLTPVLSAGGGELANPGSGAISRDGRYVAAGTFGGDVVLWDLTDPARPRELGVPLKVESGTGHIVESVAFSPDGRMLAVAGDDDAMRLVDIHDPAHPRVLGSGSGKDLMLNAFFSPDGRWVLGANADFHGYLWDVRDPAAPKQVAVLGGFRNYVYAAAFSADGRRVALGSADHTIRVFDISDARRPRPVGAPLLGPTDYVFNAVFLEGGRELAVASNDRSVRVYDVAGAHPDRVPVVNFDLGASMFAVAAPPDGSVLYAAGRTGAVAVLPLDPKSAGAALCTLVGDPITRDEWALYVPGTAYSPPCR